MATTGWLARSGSDPETAKLARQVNVTMSHNEQKSTCGTAGRPLDGTPQKVMAGRESGVCVDVWVGGTKF